MAKIKKDENMSGVLKPEDVRPHVDKVRGRVLDLEELIPNCVEIRHIKHMLNCIEEKLQRGVLKAILK